MKYQGFKGMINRIFFIYREFDYFAMGKPYFFVILQFFIILECMNQPSRINQLKDPFSHEEL